MLRHIFAAAGNPVLTTNELQRIVCEHAPHSSADESR